MAIFTVGPNSDYPTIAAAMAAAGPGDTIQLEADYSNETAIVTHTGMIITGEASSFGIVLQLGSGIATVTLGGDAPIDVVDASDGNNIVGNDGNNLITVTAGADAASGGLGEDRLFVDYRLATGAVTGNSTSNFAEAGGGGRLVTVNGGFEHFTVWTGAGADTITTGAGNDDIRTGEGTGTVTAGEGANYIVGGSGADTITAGSGGNFVDAGDGTNMITTGAGMDEILSGLGADTIVSGAGDDSITVRGGADTVDAGGDTDRLIVDYSAAVTAVTGGITGGNLISGYSGHIADLAGATVDFVATEGFSITTGTGNDSIRTGAANDMIATGGGDDSMDGGAGQDTMSGGTGNDTFIVDDADDLVIELAGEGNDRIAASASYALNDSAEVEILEARNLTDTNVIDLTGNAIANTIIGNNGGSALGGLGGDDVIFGLAGDDSLDGGDGNDVLVGGAGADTMAGGDGNDTYYAEDSGDLVTEAEGGGFDRVAASASFALASDAEVEVLEAVTLASTAALNLTGSDYGNAISGNNGVNVLDGGSGADVLLGYGGFDILVGGEGDDILVGGAGDDSMVGGIGNDTYYVEDAGDFVGEEFGAGADRIAASTSYTLNAGAEVELIEAVSLGATNAMDLKGSDFANTIIGNAGANVIDGADGADVLIGAGGADGFAFTSALGAGNVDLVADFAAGTDKVLLDDAIFTGLSPGALPAGAFVTGSAAGDADDRIVYDGATGQLFFDADGNGAGAAILFATLQGAPVIAASDFTVI